MLSRAVHLGYALDHCHPNPLPFWGWDSSSVAFLLAEPVAAFVKCSSLSLHPWRRVCPQELLVCPPCVLWGRGEDVAWFSVLGPDANAELQLVDQFSSRVTQPPALLPSLFSHH